METIGYYVSTQPLARVAKALARMSRANHFGGEVTSVKRKVDRNGGLMAMFTIMTPALSRQRCTIFASVYPRYEEMIEVGTEVVLRGRMDGSSLLVDAAFDPEDVRHFKVLEATAPDGAKERQPFQGSLATVTALEQAGYRVRLL
jgi:DNA polymerase III alpha subunit